MCHVGLFIIMALYLKGKTYKYHIRILIKFVLLIKIIHFYTVNENLKTNVIKVKYKLVFYYGTSLSATFIIVLLHIISVSCTLVCTIYGLCRPTTPWKSFFIELSLLSLILTFDIQKCRLFKILYYYKRSQSEHNCGSYLRKRTCILNFENKSN